MKRSKFLSILGLATLAPKIILEASEKVKEENQIPIWTNDGSLGVVEYKDFDYSRPINLGGNLVVKGEDLILSIKNQ